MVKLSEVYGGSEGRFLNAQICDEEELWGKQLTISDYEIREIRDRKKVVLMFEEIDDLLVLNRTNASILAEAFGEELDDWKGQPITLKKVKRTFQGKLVDAIEVEPLVEELDATEVNTKSKKKSRKGGK